MNRPDELRDEARHLASAASFLIDSAERKLQLAAQLERMSRTDRLGGGRHICPAPASVPRCDGG